MRATPLCSMLFAAAACSGTIGDPGASLDPSDPRSPQNPNNPNHPNNPNDPNDPEDPNDPNDPQVCAPAPMPNVVRLTHGQYDNTVRAILELDASVVPSASFIADAAFGGFDNNAAGLSVSERLTRDYRRSAENLAAMIAADEAAIDRLVPCARADRNDDCARRFITSIGRRAYRRPLSSGDVDRLNGLFGVGATAYTEGDAFVRGVRIVIEAVLQSPRFLYRVELADQPIDAGAIALDDFELASRLSYMLWNGPPDDTLFAAAEAGRLSDPAVIESEARRMLDDPRAAGPVDDFHKQWLVMGKYRGLAKNAALFPEFDSEQFGASMSEETYRFIRNVFLETNGDLRALYTAPYTFADSTLAPIYGATVDGPGFEKIELDPTKRVGLFMQSGFLASHAFPDISSPIHRGVFLQRNVLCNIIPDPPGNADLNLPPIEGEIETTREQVTVHTSPDACRPCHSQINEAGFSFEHFDALGRYRSEENGVPIDAHGTLVVGRNMVSFTDSVDLMKKLAEEEQVRRCYLTQWFKYAYGRVNTAEDRCTIDQLHTAVQAKDYGLKEMMVALTQTRTFRFRAEGGGR